MTNRDFIYWLNGFFELSEEDEYVDKRHLNSILKHIELVEGERSPEETDSFISGVISSIEFICKGLLENYSSTNSIVGTWNIRGLLSLVLTNVTVEKSSADTSIDSKKKEMSKEISKWVDQEQYLKGYVDVFTNFDTPQSIDPDEWSKPKTLFLTC